MIISLDRRVFIILPQMSGYIKCFDNGRRNMYFMIRDDNVLVKYNKIWNKVRKTLGIKFLSQLFMMKNA